MKRFVTILTLLFATSAFAQIHVPPTTPEQVAQAMHESPGAWADDAIELVVNRGIYIGYPDGTFQWRNDITRAEMAVVIARLILHYGLDEFNPSEVATLRAALAELEAALADDLDSLVAWLLQHDHDIEQLRAGLRANDEDNAALWLALQDANDAIANLRAAFAALDVVALEARVLVLEDEVADLWAALRAGDSAGEDTSWITAALDAKQQEIDSLHSRVAALEATQADHEARITALEGLELGSGGTIDLSAVYARLQSAEDSIEALRAHEARIIHLEEKTTPARNALYIALAAMGTDPNEGIIAKATVGYDQLFDNIGFRVSYEHSFGTGAANVSGAVTYTTSFGRSDGYFGVGGGMSFETPQNVFFGELFVGISYRVADFVAIYAEGRYRPYFDSTVVGGTTNMGGVGAGIQIRF